MNSLAGRIDRLFTRRLRPDNRPYSNREVAQELTRRGVKISHTHLWELRNGQAGNPPLRTLQALAEFFGVSPSYFFDEPEPDQQLTDAVQVAMRDLGVREVALRAHGLDDQALHVVLGVLDQIRSASGKNAVTDR